MKNETDAVSVFDKILNEKKTNEANTIADFVEEVNYVQGLYPDNEKDGVGCGASGTEAEEQEGGSGNTIR